MSSGFIKCWNFLDHMLHLFLPHPLPLLLSFGITCIQSVFCPCCSFPQMFNAKQVTEWCLYVIGLNFLKYESVEKEFELIVSEHSQFFEKHCWPPQDHRKVLKKYRQSAKRNRWDKRQLTQRGSSCLPLNCHVMQDVKKNWLGTVVCRTCHILLITLDDKQIVSYIYIYPPSLDIIVKFDGGQLGQ